MSWVIHKPVQYDKQPVVGEGQDKAQCAVLAQWFNRAIPKTYHWKRGEQVKGKVLIPGTVIATFNSNGDYANTHGKHPKEFHTALYVEQDAQGIKVIEQYHGLLHIKANKYFFGDRKNIESNADNYYVVEQKHDKSWHHD